MHVVNDSPLIRTVLYVEDDDINAMLMHALFERRPDLRLQVTTSCAEALRCARASRPDLLLLDLRLPDGHGSALLAQLRALPGLRTVRAVAVTAEDLRGLTLRGFDDLWPKPLKLLQVLDQLDHWLPPHHPWSQDACGSAGVADSGGAVTPGCLSMR